MEIHKVYENNLRVAKIRSHRYYEKKRGLTDLQHTIHLFNDLPNHETIVENQYYIYTRKTLHISFFSER